MKEKPLIVATRKFTDPVETRLRRDFNARLNPNDTVFNRAGLIAAADGASGLLVTASERVDASVLDDLPSSVRIICTLSAGTDHIDLEAARARGVTVCHTPDVLNEACADIAMLLLLAASRRAFEGDRLVRGRDWRGWAPTQLLGREIHGKRLGIYGMGRIGQAVARRARGFGLTVHYHNRRRLSAEAEAGAIYHDDADALVAVSNFFSLNCPSTAETRKFLNADRIARLPDHAVVVNISRGDLIDDDALIAALASGRIAAAGLDVFDNEPDINPGYRDLDNVFLLPHIGSATHETRDAMGFMLLDALDAYFDGAAVPHRIV